MSQHDLKFDLKINPGSGDLYFMVQCLSNILRFGRHLFISIKNFDEVPSKLKSREFRASSFSTNDFSMLYITLPQNIFKQKLTYLIETTFLRQGLLFLLVMIGMHSLLMMT